MKKIFIITMLVLCISCEINTDKTPTQKQDYRVRIIDGFEYIECDYGIVDQRVYSLTHKGNCKNHKTKT